MTEPVGDPVVDPPVTEPAPPPVDRSFTADDVERIVRERLARAKNTPPADYDDLKTKAAEFDRLQEANKSELEKAQQKNSELEKAVADAAAQTQEARLRVAVVTEAAKKNVVDPDAALALLDRATLEFDSDGNPSNIAEAMDSLLKAKPYLLATNGGARGNADQGARSAGGPAQVTAAELDAMTPAQVLKAEQEGRLHSLMTGASK